MKPYDLQKNDLAAILRDEVLLQVQKPSRYLGTEYNAVHKDPFEVELRVALVFPDLYDMGLGNLGLMTLYCLLNDLPACWAERAYAPAPDLEDILRNRGLPLFTNESKTPLSHMDLIGFTLQSELTYTNVVNLIDLAGLPIRTRDRGGEHPLVMAGGPGAFNPEPLAPFIDFFVVGDGEDVVVEIAELLCGMRGAPRDKKLEALAELGGIYVPSLYPTETLPDGRVLPVADGPKIVRRVLADLESGPCPTRHIVPFTQQIHDRVGLEVLRGCTRGCRFCQAGMVTRPVRERSPETVTRLMGLTMDHTGHEEFSLLSLSTCDHSRVHELVSGAAQFAQSNRVSVALPSLRLDPAAVSLADRLAGLRRTGLTVAPEAATARLRAVINKGVTDDDLLAIAREAASRGWGHIKTYFMIGLPTECDGDLEAIVDLCVRTRDAARTANPKAKVHTGISTFVPKPFTPFQWAEQIGIGESKRRQAILEKGLRKHPGIKFGRHNPIATFIEGLLARADRRAADLIEAAWRRGARFESWDERLDLQAWTGAIEETGYDVAAALGARELEDRLPWDHIDALVRKPWLQEEWAKAIAGESVEDCRQTGCHACGVNDRFDALCETMRDQAATVAPSEEGPPGQHATAAIEQEPVQRLRFRIGRSGEARFLSHLELVNAWVRALRRAQMPLSYSKGFHAHPKVTFATAPPVGEESTGDFMDIILDGRVDAQASLDRLRSLLPTGFAVFEVEEVPVKGPALMSLTTGFLYRFYAVGDARETAAGIQEILASDEILVERHAKARKRRQRRSEGRVIQRNIRPMIAELRIGAVEGGRFAIDARVELVDGKSVKPREILELLGLDPITTRIVKLQLRGHNT